MFVFKIYLIGTIGDSRAATTEVLVELAYGIFLSGSVNNGKLEIADVVHWLEQSLSIDLGVAYRKFISIGRRKNVSYTKYLDEVRGKIIGYISEKNSYVPKAVRK